MPRFPDGASTTRMQTFELANPNRAPFLRTANRSLQRDSESVGGGTATNLTDRWLRTTPLASGANSVLVELSIQCTTPDAEQARRFGGVSSGFGQGALQYGATGVATGASIGTAITPGFGTAVGAAIGGGIGVVGGALVGGYS